MEKEKKKDLIIKSRSTAVRGRTDGRMDGWMLRYLPHFVVNNKSNKAMVSPLAD